MPQHYIFDSLVVFTKSAPLYYFRVEVNFFLRCKQKYCITVAKVIFKLESNFLISAKLLLNIYILDPCKVRITQYK